MWNGVGGALPLPSLASDKFAVVGTALLACKSQGLALPGPVQSAEWSICSSLHRVLGRGGPVVWGGGGGENANSVATSGDLMALGTFPE